MRNAVGGVSRAVAAIVLSLLTVTAVRAAQPPGTVTGVVRDGTGAVIVRVEVVLQTAEQTAVRSARTGEDGRFTFENVPPGRYVLVVSFRGFADRRVAVAASNRASRPVDITLEPTPFQAEVTVTATAGAVQDRQSVPQ
jgi:hypothetical protein